MGIGANVKRTYGRKKTRVGGLGWGELGLLLLGVLVLKGLDVGGKEPVKLAAFGIGLDLLVPVVVLFVLVEALEQGCDAFKGEDDGFGFAVAIQYVFGL